MKRKKGYRSVALVLVLFMVITAVMMQTECEVYAATPVSSHGRLSVKGADLIDFSFVVSVRTESTGM